MPSDVKGKVTKKITSKKRKFADADTARAAAVAAAQSVQREEVLGVEFRLPISFLQHRGQL